MQKYPAEPSAALTSVFFILIVILGVVAWLFVLAHESRRVAQAETKRQTALLEAEIEAHKVTDAKLQAAKETAEAATRGLTTVVPHAPETAALSGTYQLPAVGDPEIAYDRIRERPSVFDPDWRIKDTR